MVSDRKIGETLAALKLLVEWRKKRKNLKVRKETATKSNIRTTTDKLT